jgi:hypothetical protein
MKMPQLIELLASLVAETVISELVEVKMENLHGCGGQMKQS